MGQQCLIRDRGCFVIFLVILEDFDPIEAAFYCRKQHF